MRIPRNRNLTEVKDYRVLRRVLVDAWHQIRSLKHISQPATITFPGPDRKVKGDILVVPEVHTGFYFWRGGDQNRQGIWVFSDIENTPVVPADFEFNLPKNNRSRSTFGRVLDDSGRLILAHVGQLGGGRRSVNRGQFAFLAGKAGAYPINVEEQLFFPVSPVRSKNLARDLAAYARLCRAIRSQSVTPSGGVGARGGLLDFRSGFNPGYEGEFVRSARVSAGTHRKIVNCLKSACERLGWKVIGSSIVSPDLLVGRGGKKAMFEVKPEATSSCVMMGIGELLVYGKANNVKGLYLIIPDLERCWSSPFFECLKTVLDDNGIGYGGCFNEGDAWRFPGLRQHLQECANH